MQENNNSETLPGAGNIGASGGGENVSEEVVSISTLLSSELKRDFKTDEEALKAVKDTFAYVGKTGKFLPALERLQAKFGGDERVVEMLNGLEKADVKPPVDTSQFVPREQYDTDTFFSRNPQYQEHRELVEALRKSTGKSLAEVVEIPTFKSVVEKAKAHDEAEKSKSVLHTNSRIGQATDKMSKARESLKQGKVTDAHKSAVAAVIEANKLQ